MKKGLLAVDLFSGIGCASLGFIKGGFKIAGSIEIDPLRCANYERNIGLKPIQTDISQIDGEEIMSLLSLKKTDNFCLVGCPPCQSFSKLSDTRGINALKDPRSKHVLKFAKLVEEMKPAVVVFENVPWMVLGPGRKFFAQYCRILKKIGYDTASGILDAANYGVPQHRRRIVTISKRKGIGRDKKLELPSQLLSEFNFKTVRDAIGDLPPLKSGQSDPRDRLHRSRDHTEKTLEIIRNIPKNGGSRMALPKKLWLPCHKRIKRGADNVYGRLWWDKPSSTITGQCTSPSCGRFLHPEQDRGISIREACRLQTIPNGWILEGSTDNLERMIGDAVPVQLAYAIASTVGALMTKS